MEFTYETMKYLKSNEVKKILKVSDCKLAHIRLEGKLPYVKKGNAFLYVVNGVEYYKNLSNDLSTEI